MLFGRLASSLWALSEFTVPTRHIEFCVAKNDPEVSPGIYLDNESGGPSYGIPDLGRHPLLRLGLFRGYCGQDMKFNTPKLIVICATQRCGSTMVVEDMRATGVLGVPEEYFIPWKTSNEDIDWSQQLRQIEKKSSTDNGVAAVKIMANQLLDIENCLRDSWDDETPTGDGIYPFNTTRQCSQTGHKSRNVPSNWHQPRHREI